MEKYNHLHFTIHPNPHKFHYWAQACSAIGRELTYYAALVKRVKVLLRVILLLYKCCMHLSPY